MATLEGNELVNVESVTALMSLFGAKYRASYFSGSVLTGHNINKQTPTFEQLSSDGTTFSFKQTGSSDADKITNFSFVAGEDSLWYVDLSGNSYKSGDNLRNEYTISVSDSSLVLSPTARTIDFSSDTLVSYLTLYLRLKKGVSFSVRCDANGPMNAAYGSLIFKVFRVC